MKLQKNKNNNHLILITFVIFMLQNILIPQ